MRWYQVDSDTPNDPKIKRLMAEAAALEGPEAAAGQVGHLFLIWCFVANHGAEPGMGVKADGSPLDLDDMAYETAFGHQTKLRAFLDLLASRGLIGAAEWQQGIVFLPAMKTRADAYAKSKGRGPSEPEPQAGPGGHGRGKAGPRGGRRAHAGPQGPLHNITGQDTTPPEETPGDLLVPDLLADAGEDHVDALVRIWNTERKPGPTVRDVTPQRRAAYGRALKAQPDLAIWRDVIAYLNGQPWCNAKGGGDHPNWRADLDWLAKPGKLAVYADKAAAERPARPGAVAGRNAAKGRTGYKRGEFAAALGGDDGPVH